MPGACLLDVSPLPLLSPGPGAGTLESRHPSKQPAGHVQSLDSLPALLQIISGMSDIETTPTKPSAVELDSPAPAPAEQVDPVEDNASEPQSTNEEPTEQQEQDESAPIEAEATPAAVPEG